MSNFKTHRSNDDELTSPSSDEKMDTGSESFRSQDTPNSVLSSDFEGDHPEPVLRLQNPEIVRLSEPERFNDSLISKMSNLHLDSPRPKNLGISPPKFSSTLTLTTSHPLMSPDENYPDLIPKKIHKIDDEKDLSLSSIEDERPNENNGFYSPQRNTSKNNLYFTESFVTAEDRSQDLTGFRSQDLDLTVPPDVARVDKVARRKIVPKLRDGTPQKADRLLKNNEEKRMQQSTPKTQPVDISAKEEFHSVAEWCESPSHLRSMPNFELPIEMSSSIGMHNDLDSPDVISASTQEDRSAYQALLDPYTGSVALRHTPAQRRSPGAQRRKIQLPPEEDRCSLDSSVSVCSMESEDEPPEPQELETEPVNQHLVLSDDEGSKMSKSTNTLSEGSDPIPEYSAAEELSNERAWISVPRAGGHATCDMKVIEPYKRVISHGGYDGGGAALIVFSACHLPDCARPDYTYCMDNLFLYVIWTLERLVTDDYVLVYLHGSAGRRRLPTFHWLHECYKLIDRSWIWTLERLVTDDYVLVYLHGSAGRRRLPTFHWLHECYKLIDRSWIWTLERLVTDDYVLVYLHGSAGRRRLPTFHWLHECYKLIDRSWIWTLERLVTDDYVLVYLHGSAGRRRLPTFHWLHECYKLIDRRLRKSLKHLYLVHPTFWLKSFVILTKPFVSSKFFRKLSYVRSLSELMQKVPIEPNAIPELVKQFDASRR
ncbi:hypothetical protein PYW07_011895 [Mythimna separata]|uniref:CRAL-TRIO domain-containing protein n=1 Tax=Mythimna separata TaxID=271217 RepID=A0AAD8DK04_MYTSE|nr:hypothetical protein PYW07_011895 [Mythimna separata]